jgi:hypothetical protein
MNPMFSLTLFPGIREFRFTLASVIPLLYLGIFSISTDPAQAQTATTVCGLGAPSGYVAVGYTNISGCGSFFGNNATIVDIPRPGLTSCGLGAPSGYVAVGYMHNPSCVMYNSTFYVTTNATIMDTPRSGLTICGLGVPSGYVAAGYTRNPSCEINYGIPSTFIGNNATVIR